MHSKLIIHNTKLTSITTFLFEQASQHSCKILEQKSYRNFDHLIFFLVLDDLMARRHLSITIKALQTYLTLHYASHPDI